MSHLGRSLRRATTNLLTPPAAWPPLLAGETASVAPAEDPHPQRPTQLRGGLRDVAKADEAAGLAVELLEQSDEPKLTQPVECWMKETNGQARQATGFGSCLGVQWSIRSAVVHQVGGDR